MANNDEQLLTEEKTFIIIGAGASGLFTARALEKAGIPSKNITILESDNEVGGKCSTYIDPLDPDLTTEFGAALVAHNYRVVLDAIFEKNIPLESVLPTKLASMDFMKQYLQENTCGKLVFSAEFVKELLTYEKLLREYEYARDHKHPLPPAFELPFSEFAKLKGLTKINDLLRPIVTGFGYGAMQVCPTFAVFEYIGHTTIPAMRLIPSLVKQGPFYAIQGGFQRLMRALAADYQVITNVDIKSIDRSDGIKVEFLHQNTPKTLKANYLILALSPVQWPKLGLELSPTEKLALQNLTYYRYPVAICRLKGYESHQEFFEHGLQPEGFGELALITTRDARPNPEDGRLCTAYVNLPQGANNYDLSPNTAERKKLQSELEQLPGIEEVMIVKTKTWDDYMSMLPWSIRCQLESEQFADNTHTGYVNSCLSFEDVGCVANYGAQLIAKKFACQPDKVYDTSLTKDFQRMFCLFKTPQLAPISKTKEKNYDSDMKMDLKEETEDITAEYH
ncbi:FAD-dependent oxidoreductase [Legionella brunensis]|uniref:Tryptophan 2-monooxygenase n=1 Tax=Legionella brunensis TaxID=29422 RepID=A0A0W0S5D7_9GAMM|nr:FAD-dependent oxidoreductase [Legionella brunensis]KTC78181.1 protoporphyrinogen oxidase [Legionella brunensis]